MRVGVLRRDEWRNTGIERFESKVVPWLLKQNGFEPINFSISNSYPLSATLSRLKLGRKVRKTVERKDLDLVFVPSQDLMLNINPEDIDAQVVPYVHDILTVTTAFTSSFVKTLDKRAMYNIEKCQKVISASDTTGLEIFERTGFSGRYETVYQGVEDQKESEDVGKNSREIDILYIGTLIDRKDPMLIRKVAELAEDRGFNMAAINYEELELPCETYENISDNRLAELLDNSKYYLHPSFQEGFGRGAVEAQRRGVPVIARDNQINNEILGHFLPFDSAEEVLGFIENFDEWNLLSERSRQNSNNYQWKDTRRELLTVLKGENN